MTFVKEYVSFLFLTAWTGYAIYKVLLPSTPLEAEGLLSGSRAWWGGMAMIMFLLSLFCALTSALKKITDHEKEERKKKAKRVLVEQD